MNESLIDTYKFEINTGKYGSVNIQLINDTYVVNINNIRWMLFNPNTRIQIKEMKLHYELAEGNVISTGLGLGLREQLLLCKEKVKSLTVLEKSLDLINFHKTFSKWIHHPKLKIINTSVEKFRGDCDVLLLDHYEQQNFTAILNDVVNTSKNINCKTMWFWPFEDYIIRNAKEKNYNFIESYNDLKSKYNLNKFPELTEYQLIDCCEPFNVRK